MFGNLSEMEQPRRKRGRPPKKKPEQLVSNMEQLTLKLPKKSGRPPKIKAQHSVSTYNQLVSNVEQLTLKLPKKRGRPPKIKTEHSDFVSNQLESNMEHSTLKIPKIDPPETETDHWNAADNRLNNENEPRSVETSPMVTFGEQSGAVGELGMGRLEEPTEYLDRIFEADSSNDSVLFKKSWLDADISEESCASVLADGYQDASEQRLPEKKKRRGRPPKTDKTFLKSEVDGSLAIESSGPVSMEEESISVHNPRTKRNTSSAIPYSAPLATNLTGFNTKLVPNCSYLKQNGSWESDRQSFRSKLMGKEAGTCKDLIVSPYSQKVLYRDIWRDWSTVPFRVRLHSELLSKVQKKRCQPPKVPLRYSYIQPEFLPAINFLAGEFFWPDIDMSESLRYPECSCVALYNKVVVGFAFLTPDVTFNEYYLSFVFTLPHWRQAGIASFMLFLLIRSFPDKNISLHCGASNPAMVLYQKMGFRIEQFLPYFYEHYLPSDSPESRHAYLLRLKRS